MVKKTKKERAIHRVRIVKGLMSNLEKAIVEDMYCIDVLQQSLAIRRALKSLDHLILENHLNTCVKAGMKEGSSSDKLTKELVEIFKLSN